MFRIGAKIYFSEKISIQYLIYGGTALSVFRERDKIICHDYDIDIAILKTDFSKLFGIYLPSQLRKMRASVSVPDAPSLELIGLTIEGVKYHLVTLVVGG